MSDEVFRAVNKAYDEAKKLMELEILMYVLRGYSLRQLSWNMQTEMVDNEWCFVGRIYTDGQPPLNYGRKHGPQT